MTTLDETRACGHFEANRDLLTVPNLEDIFEEMCQQAKLDTIDTVHQRWNNFIDMYTRWRDKKTTERAAEFFEANCDKDGNIAEADELVTNLNDIYAQLRHESADVLTREKFTAMYTDWRAKRLASQSA